MQFRHRRHIQKQRLCTNGETMPLIELSEGEKSVVTQALGGCGLCRRLAEMGLTLGVEIKLLRKCPFRGPLEVEIRGVELALGYGVASKIFVKPLKAKHDS